MRRLATVRKIDNIQQIEGADFIEKATIKGWNIVVKKGDFKIGDNCIYFEIDSLLPVNPIFDFLLKGTTIKKMLVDGKEIEGIRLKTKKLKGVISQGLALRISLFNNIPNEIGFDCSEILNIIKYEAPIPACLSGNAIGVLPGYINKTDEERIQNLPEYLESFINKSFYVTEKVDGTSGSFFKHDNIFGVCSRNLQLVNTVGNTFWEIARKYDLQNKLPNDFCIQGEVLGEGIQKNRYKIKGHDIFVFYVYDILKSKYLSLPEMEEFLKPIGLKTVPVLHRELIMSFSMEEILKQSVGNSILTNCRREGVVFRLNNSDQKISFKVISNEYLLKDEE